MAINNDKNVIKALYAIHYNETRDCKDHNKLQVDYQNLVCTVNNVNQHNKLDRMVVA